MNWSAMNFRKCSVLLASHLALTVFLMFVGLSRVLAQPEIKNKKLIYYGWGSPDTRYVREQWIQMEEMPFDGVGIVVPVDRRAWAGGKRDTGNQLGWQVVGEREFRVDDFRDAIQDLKTAKWRKFSDNFLPVAVSVSQSAGLNWFDDARWRTVVNNFSVVARIAADGGIKGLILDPEQYDYSLFRYTDQQKQLGRSFDSYQEMARKRGREIVAAIIGSMPEPVILSLYGYSVAFDFVASGKSLKEAPYGLLPAFYDGLLEGLPRSATLIDGYEQAYGFKERTQFGTAYRRIQDAAKLSKMPQRYRQQVKAGFGVWLDYKGQANYLSPGEFQRAVSGALDLSDKYVWLYTEGPRFFPPTGIEPSYIEALTSARRSINR
jgi:hypothetical protein